VNDLARREKRIVLRRDGGVNKQLQGPRSQGKNFPQNQVLGRRRGDLFRSKREKVEKNYISGLKGVLLNCKNGFKWVVNLKEKRGGGEINSF